MTSRLVRYFCESDSALQNDIEQHQNSVKIRTELSVHFKTVRYFGQGDSPFVRTLQLLDGRSTAKKERYKS